VISIVVRNCAGEDRLLASVRDASEALAFLRRMADECRATGHRRVELDEDEAVLVTSYSGDDTVVTFVSEEELA
jgi:hypothetical protein